MNTPTLKSLPLVMALERIEKWNGYWTGQMGDSPADEDAMEIVRSLLGRVLPAEIDDKYKDKYKRLVRCAEAVILASSGHGGKFWKSIDDLESALLAVKGTQK
jgi:hypothetical protein